MGWKWAPDALREAKRLERSRGYLLHLVFPRFPLQPESQRLTPYVRVLGVKSGDPALKKDHSEVVLAVRKGMPVYGQVLLGRVRRQSILLFDLTPNDQREVSPRVATF